MPICCCLTCNCDLDKLLLIGLSGSLKGDKNTRNQNTGKTFMHACILGWSDLKFFRDTWGYPSKFS